MNVEAPIAWDDVLIVSVSYGVRGTAFFSLWSAYMAPGVAHTRAIRRNLREQFAQ